MFLSYQTAVTTEGLFVIFGMGGPVEFRTISNTKAAR